MNKMIDLYSVWVRRLKLRDEGDRLYAEGERVGNILKTEGEKLLSNSNKIWAEAIAAKYGDIKFKWKNWNERFGDFECHLSNGEVYGFENLKPLSKSPKRTWEKAVRQVLSRVHPG